jgi:hypothetical protein
MNFHANYENKHKLKSVFTDCCLIDIYSTSQYFSIYVIGNFADTSMKPFEKRSSTETCKKYSVTNFLMYIQRLQEKKEKKSKHREHKWVNDIRYQLISNGN